MLRPAVCAIAGFICLSCAWATASAGDGAWRRVQIDDTFRSEGVAVADVNRDGKTDVLAGDVWYEAPDWTMHAVRPVGEYQYDKGYSQSFANFARDLNGDGWPDLIVVGFPGAPFHWYENPQNEPGHWPEHVIWHSACNETPEFEDLTGDGTPELIIGSQPEKQMGFLPIPPAEDAAKKWTFHAISKPGKPRENGTHRYYHGLGAGDVNGDGRQDVLIPHGWWEAPKNPHETPWTFHSYTLSKTGQGNPLSAANLHVDDLNRDGANDIIMSSAHSYGIWWFENVSDKGASEFQYHLIDESYSQTHALEYVDINGDGQRDIVTGKRFYAHQGKDPGGKEAVVMYWYEVHPREGGPQIIPHEIEAGRGTGVGTQFVVTDLNGDTLPDVALSNKKGVNLLLQRRGDTAGQ